MTRLPSANRSSLAFASAIAALAPRLSGAQQAPMHDHAAATNPLDRMEGPLGLSWMREASGTAWQPDATPMFGHMQRVGAWSFMEHYNVFFGYDATTGARGASQFFSTNWLMVMARTTLLGGQLGARVMLSAEPGTVVDGGYPLLLQSGETDQGQPLHDRQHPHDLFMEVALSYQRELAAGVAIQVYLAASGEPALGPWRFRIASARTTTRSVTSAITGSTRRTSASAS